ncbi:MAG: fused DSP-PTPase phosphatase/NAD kinase-like protein [Thermoanaerobaculia bacterium]
MRSRALRILVAVLAAAILMAAPGPAAAERSTWGIPNASFPLPGVMAAGQPTGEQIQLMVEEGGYRTVIDLRLPGEPRGFDEAEAARQIGLTYVNIPVTPETLDQATIDRFLAVFRKAERPVFVHCSNSVRTAGLLYAWLVLEKREPAAKALERAKAAGLRGPEMTERVQKLVAERQALSPKPSPRPRG